MTGAIFYLVSNLALAAAAWLIGDLATGGRETWRHHLATLTGFAILVELQLLVLGNLGILTAAAVTLTSTGILGAILLVHRARATPPRVQEAESREADTPPESPQWRLPLVVLIFFVAPVLGRLVFGPTFFHWDDYSYHATGPAQWLLDHRISLAPFDYHANFPLNAELFSLWFLLPLKQDAFASLAALY